MQPLIDLLLKHPLALVLLVGAVFQGIGKLLEALGRTRRPGRPGAGARQRPTPTPARPSAGTPGRRSAEEVAAEMRRILGMDPVSPPRPQAPAPQTGSQSAGLPPRLPSVAAERPPEPLRKPTFRSLALHADPHVGETLRRRVAPSSGGVGGRAMGTLGGRVEGRRRPERSGSHLVDLDDLARAVVLTEVLGPPVALRDPMRHV